MKCAKGETDCTFQKLVSVSSSSSQTPRYPCVTSPSRMPHRQHVDAKKKTRETGGLASSMQLCCMQPAGIAYSNGPVFAPQANTSNGKCCNVQNVVLLFQIKRQLTVKVRCHIQSH